MRHRLTVQEPVETQNETGEYDITWTTVGTVWGAIEPMKGRERLQADQIGAEMDTRIRIRWSPLTETMNAKYRLVHQGVNYNIVSLAEYKFARDEIEVMAVSGRNNG